ncbi:hypothetical protein THAOC_02430 [Thalassiosira oceanica]|uniref:AB hydrolase-1 domain-containing protein n=1 Tax=Thalassiosira oceanica TaxID=159749 RepID=K0TQD0_THAOC|nr:hypothetical protein THAOC_02430 [Thalassiosira oceanica]|eukprot:EJK75832.1 hypothetical protein THAOC_02430 [Thalassiosira oceanica]
MYHIRLNCSRSRLELRRPTATNFIANFDEDKAISFSRKQTSWESLRRDLDLIGYPVNMYERWMDDGRIHETENGVYSEVNPAFRALCYRHVFDTDCGTGSWDDISGYCPFDVHLMVAGIGTVCDEESITDMKRILPDLRVKIYPEAGHSIHSSCRGEFVADLESIINEAERGNCKL